MTSSTVREAVILSQHVSTSRQNLSISSCPVRETACVRCHIEANAAVRRQRLSAPNSCSGRVQHVACSSGEECWAWYRTGRCGANPHAEGLSALVGEELFYTVRARYLTAGVSTCDGHEVDAVAWWGDRVAVTLAQRNGSPLHPARRREPETGISVAARG